jgi:excisionase family DNA binding protein
MNYITTAQAAQQWGVSARMVQHWIEQGRIPAQKFGRDWMIPEDAQRPKDLRYVENPIRNRRKSPV